MHSNEARKREHIETVLTANGAGRWVLPENPKALAEAVCRLADDDSLSANLACNALTASLKYGRHRQAQEMLQVLEIADAGWGARAGTASDGRNSMTS